MKKIIKKLTTSALLALMVISCVSINVLAAPLSAPQLPDSIVVDGREFVKDELSGGFNTAIPDNEVAMFRASYRVLGSDVKLYTDPNPHGHGPEHFASGWVQTTAPRFYARAEVRLNGTTFATSGNEYNPAGSNIADATTVLCDYNTANKAYIFYGW